MAQYIRTSCDYLFVLQFHTDLTVPNTNVMFVDDAPIRKLGTKKTATLTLFGTKLALVEVTDLVITESTYMIWKFNDSRAMKQHLTLQGEFIGAIDSAEQLKLLIRGIKFVQCKHRKTGIWSDVKAALANLPA
jgi:hypothetical protein